MSGASVSDPEGQPVGFNIYRQETGGERVKLNPTLLTANPVGSLAGSEYIFVDATPAQSAAYWIEWVGSDNSREQFGPLDTSASFKLFLLILR